MQWIFTHFPRGLPTSSLFFFAISPLILKGLVPILQHLCWIFRNTPTFFLSDGFQRSYGYFFLDHPFFWLTLYEDHIQTVDNNTAPSPPSAHCNGGLMFSINWITSWVLLFTEYWVLTPAVCTFQLKGWHIQYLFARQQSEVHPAHCILLKSRHASWHKTLKCLHFCFVLFR